VSPFPGALTPVSFVAERKGTPPSLISTPFDLTSVDLSISPTGERLSGARVVRYSGSFQQIEAPEAWTVATDPAGTGLILTPAARLPGTSPDTITITLETFDFVYSSQHVNPLWNRASIWVGKCRLEGTR
jgi:hypothetical protein